MKSIDILIDIQVVPLTADGIATVLHGLLPALFAIDSVNTYFLIGNSDSFPSLCPMVPNVQGAIWLKNRSATFHRLITQHFFDGIKVNRLSPRIFFSPATLLPYGLSSKIKAIPVIHDLAIYRIPNIYPKAKILYRKFLFENVIRRADHLVSISDTTKRDIQGIFNIPSSKITVIPNGTSIPICSSSSPDEISVHCQRLKLPERYILFVGNIMPRKNIARLIRAFDILAQRSAGKDTFLVIVGKFVLMTKEVESAFSSATCKNRICFMGEVSDEDLVWFYRCATIFAYVSLYEGFGLPILEAMASGTAVLTSNLGAMAEVAGNAALLVNPLDIEEIAYALEQILLNQHLQKSLLVKGFNQVKRYTWESSAKEYVALWNKILK